MARLDEIYRRPTDRFVASFVGDVNVLRAQLEEVYSEAARIAIGAAKLTVSAGTLRGCAPGSPVELFIRPEQLRPAEDGEATACEGVVSAHSYQGGHVDLHIASEAAISGRILIRQPSEAIARWPVGTRIACACAGTEAVAFPASQG